MINRFNSDIMFNVSKFLSSSSQIIMCKKTCLGLNFEMENVCRVRLENNKYERQFLRQGFIEWYTCIKCNRHPRRNSWFRHRNNNNVDVEILHS